MKKIPFNGIRAILLTADTETSVGEWYSGLSLSQTGEKLSGTAVIYDSRKVASLMKIQKCTIGVVIHFIFSFVSVKQPFKSITITKQLRPGDVISWELRCVYLNGEASTNTMSGSQALFDFLDLMAKLHCE